MPEYRFYELVVAARHGLSSDPTLRRFGHWTLHRFGSIEDEDLGFGYLDALQLTCTAPGTSYSRRAFTIPEAEAAGWRIGPDGITHIGEEP